MAELLTPLADYSRQTAQVGTPPANIYDAKGRKLNPDLLQLSTLLRIANFLEGNEGPLTARLLISVHEAADFRDLVGRLDGNPAALAITTWRLLDYAHPDGQRLEVALSYEEGQALFLLGRHWEDLCLRPFLLAVADGQLAELRELVNNWGFRGDDPELRILSEEWLGTVWQVRLSASLTPTAFQFGRIWQQRVAAYEAGQPLPTPFEWTSCHNVVADGGTLTATKELEGGPADE